MRLKWDDAGLRTYEVGIECGVFYPKTGPGVPWNGLTTITESVEGDGQVVVYLDGQKQVNQLDLGTFSATLEAFTYPDEFLPYDGYAQPLFTSQIRPTFNFTYRSLISDVGYKLHLVYNCLVKPSARSNNSLNSDPDISSFSWGLSTIPVAFPYDRPTSHIFIDSTLVSSEILSHVEDVLYGSDGADPRFPTIAELLAIFETNALITIVDLGDGSFTATGPNANVTPTDDSTEWIFDWPNVVQISDDTYLASSY